MGIADGRRCSACLIDGRAQLGPPARGTAVMIALVAAGLLGGCRQEPATPTGKPDAAAPSAAATPTGPLNVVLISIDTLRADHLGCYGHPIVRTPHIDRMAKEGVTFLQCTASIPVTLPSHTSMLTGTHPFVHGVRDNGTYFVHEDNLTLPEVMKDAGYTTAAMVAAFVLNREFGLNQGFDVYDDMYATTQRDDENALTTQRPADDVIDNTLRWLASAPDEPFFLFVHLFDPHQPYEPPERFRRQYMEAYVGEIAFTDEQIGRLLTALAEQGLDDHTLVVITADHGEGRGEHGEDTHATYIYDSTLAVPLIFRCPGLVPAGRRVDAQVRLVDLPHTILDLIGLNTDLMPDSQGVSLRPLVLDENQDLSLGAYSESLYGMFNFGFAPLRSWREDGWKYILAPRPELYRVQVDAGELDNRIEQEPERAARMRAALRRYVEQNHAASQGGTTHAVAGEDIAKLQALGYVGSGQTPQEFDELALLDPAGPDPKDHVEYVALTARAVGASGRQEPHAEDLLRRCIAEAPDPEFVPGWAYQQLAQLLVARQEFAEAADMARRSLASTPDDSRTMTTLAMCLMKLGELEEAQDMAQAALAEPPNFAQTYAVLASIRASQGQATEALDLYREALRRDPKLTYVYPAMANIQIALGRQNDAIATYEEALELAPDRAAWRRELAVLLALEGDAAALEHYRQVLDREPNNADAHAGLGEVHQLLGNLEEAERSFRRALELDPQCIQARDALGLLLHARGKPAGAIATFDEGVEAGVRHPNMANNLAWLLATLPEAGLRNGERALELAEQACKDTQYRNANFLDTLAAAYAETGQFDQAVETIDRALQVVDREEHPDLAAQLEAHRARYIERRPCHGC